ncbi:MAG: hypothetical protein AB7H96_09320 [Vicinamibacterales bacterium]
MLRRRPADDEQVVTTAMRSVASGDMPPSRLDPSFIWWKAQLMRRLDAEREAVAPLEVGDRIHLGAAVLGAVALAAGAWEYLPALTRSPLIALTTGGAALLLISVIAAAAIEAVRHR